MGETLAGDDDQDTPPESPPEAPAAYLTVLNRLWNCRIPDKAVNGFGAVTTAFAASLPSDFEQRLGKAPTDPFYSGVFTAPGGVKIVFIRIPSYAPTSATAALTAFAKEIAYFQENTDLDL